MSTLKSPIEPGLLRRTLTQRVVIADGAMGTMLQAANPSLEDFEGHEGCNEILNVSRADIVRSVHDEYLQAGVDAIETNTFGANWANLAEYGIEDRIYELAFAGGKIAREAADAFSTPDKPRFVLGSLGPGLLVGARRLVRLGLDHTQESRRFDHQGLLDESLHLGRLSIFQRVASESNQRADSPSD